MLKWNIIKIQKIKNIRYPQEKNKKRYPPKKTRKKKAFCQMSPKRTFKEVYFNTNFCEDGIFTKILIIKQI